MKLKQIITQISLISLCGFLAVPAFGVSALGTLDKINAHNTTHASTERKSAQYTQGKSSKYAIVYIFSSECPYCQKFTPILNEFKLRHPDLPVHSFSLDGKGLPGFEQPMRATQGVTEHFFHTPKFIYPATFFVNVETNKFTGLTYQLQPLEVLEERISLLTHTPNLLKELD